MPQNVVVEDVFKNQIMNRGDDNSVEVIDLGDALTQVEVTLQFSYLSRTDALYIMDFFVDPLKANGMMNTFWWSNYAEPDDVRRRYTVRFAEPRLSRGIFRPGFQYEVTNVKLVVVGRGQEA